MPEIQAMVRLSFPVTNMPHERTSEDGRYAELQIEDGASGETLARISFSPDEWMLLSGGEVIRVDGVRTSNHLERVGWRSEHETLHLGHAAKPAQIATTIAAALADGWDEATAGRTNAGTVVNCRRWVKPDQTHRS